MTDELLSSCGGGVGMTDLVTCAVETARPDKFVFIRRPKCNRVANHEGPHREYDGHTFEVRAEWTDAEIWEPGHKNKEMHA